MHVLFHIYRGYIYCSNFCYHVLTEFNTAFGGCGYFNLPIVRSKRQTNSQAYTCVYLYPSWAHSLVHARTVGSTECQHSGLKCTPRRAPASRYVHSGIQKEYARRVRRLASFPGPARSSLAVRNSLRGPGLVHHVMSATVVFLRHQITMFAVLPIYSKFLHLCNKCSTLAKPQLSVFSWLRNCEAILYTVIVV